MFRKRKMAEKKQARKDYLARSRGEQSIAERAPRRGRPAKKQRNRHRAHEVPL